MDILAVNPRGQVPTLIDNGVVVCESGAAVQARAAGRCLCFVGLTGRLQPVSLCSKHFTFVQGSATLRLFSVCFHAGTGCRCLRRLQDTDVCVRGWQYLDTVYPEPALMPKDRKALGLVCAPLDVCVSRQSCCQELCSCMRVCPMQTPCLRARTLLYAPW
jgi:hypothetical protein